MVMVAQSYGEESIFDGLMRLIETDELDTINSAGLALVFEWDFRPELHPVHKIMSDYIWYPGHVGGSMQMSFQWYA